MDPEKPEPQLRKRRAWLLWVALICLAGVAVYLISPRVTEGQAQAKKEKAASASTAATRGVPVIAATAQKGNMVHASDQNGLAVITQLQPIAVIFSIPADSLSQVTSKMRAGQKLPVYGYDRDLKKRLATGTLLTIDNQIDQSTGTLRFKGVFENKDLSLFPNQFVNARLLVDTKIGTTIIPTAAIQRSPQSAFVYVVKPDSTVEVRDIVTNLTEGDEASVDSGLNPGDVVVIDGIDKLQQGTKVTVRMAGPIPRG